MSWTGRRRLLALVVGLLAAAALARFVLRARVRAEARAGFDLQGARYVGSAACRECHPHQHASWTRTFHRTMTVDVGPTSAGAVLAPFDGHPYRYGPVTARPLRDDAGRFWMTFTSDDDPAHPIRAEVTRAVGSHRAQQYFTRVGSSWFRLPLAYHVQEQRWLHMNGAFLTADPPELAGDVPEDSAVPASSPPPSGDSLPRFGGRFRDFDRHVTRWNDNCIFCHNVRPSPGWDEAAQAFQSTTAELGIACESCHGPGSEHLARNRNPLRRFALRDTGAADPTITNPSRLSPGRAADVCGRCHGQRMTDDVGAFLSRGDPFVAGEDLGLYSAPLWAHTPLHGDTHAFAARFWDDGTPRLSAYEYQGWLQSPCSQRGALTCISCHGMHDGAPAGQLRPSARGDGACLGCHAALASAPARGRHAVVSHGAVACVDCHMPRLVYGVMDVLRSHRIERPDPARSAAVGRPDACRLCHVGRDAAWAAAGLGVGSAERPPVEGEPASSSMLALSFGGDPLTRAVAVAALGRLDDPSLPRETRLAALREVMLRDPYPSVRRIAARAAAALAPDQQALLRRFDPTGPARERMRALDAWTTTQPGLQDDGGARLLAAQRLALPKLRRRAGASALDIGE